MIKINSRTRQRYMTGIDNTDYVMLNSTGNEVFDLEDVIVTGATSDEFGETVQTGRRGKEVNFQGTQNNLQGTDAAIEGGKDLDTNIRGNKTALTRARQRYDYLT